jgi:dihydropteroate synthase
MLRLEHLAALYEQFGEATAARVAPIRLRGREFGSQQPTLMGVINLSPDSWYRESVCLSPEQAIRRGKVLAEQGAHVVDVGAESTLAQAQRADEALQQSKLLPVIRGLHEAGIIVSAETYLAPVARACLEAGASVLNLTGCEAAETIYRLASEHEAAVIICYVQGPHVRAVGDFDLRADTVPLMYEYFARETERAARCGVRNIIIDPGLGFYYRNLQDSATRVRHQMTVFLNTFRLRPLGFPVCHALPHAFEYFGEEVRCAEPFFAVLASLGGTDWFRTHELPRVKGVLGSLGVF